MRESSAQMLVTIFGGKDVLSRSLGMENFSENECTPVLEKFCELVFRRILVAASGEHLESIIDVFETHREKGRSLDELVSSLRRYIPEMDRYISEELDKAAREFRI